MVKRTTEIPPWWEAASEVLEAAIDRDDDRVLQLLVPLGEKHGEHWPAIMFTWLDAMLLAQGITVDDYGKKTFHLHTQNVDTGSSTDPSDPVQWVSALAQARVMDDPEAYFALLRQIDSDKQFGLYVCALIQCVGITVGNALSGQLQHQRAHIHTKECTGE